MTTILFLWAAKWGAAKHGKSRYVGTEMFHRSLQLMSHVYVKQSL